MRSTCSCPEWITRDTKTEKQEDRISVRVWDLRSRPSLPVVTRSQHIGVTRQRPNRVLFGNSNQPCDPQWRDKMNVVT
jgi:hypothetical protein